MNLKIEFSKSPRKRYRNNGNGDCTRREPSLQGTWAISP